MLAHNLAVSDIPFDPWQLYTCGDDLYFAWMEEWLRRVSETHEKNS